jgi:hypothetical protein
MPASPELEFAGRFAQAWAAPTADRLTALLHDDVALYQPHRPPIRGKAAARAELAHLLHCVPGLHGKVQRSWGADGVAVIEWRMIFLEGHKGIPALDRFIVRDGLGVERVVYFDQLALFAAVLAHPRLWAGFLRYRFGAR